MSSFVAFDDLLRSQVADRLSRHKRRSHHLDGRKHAAVAIVLVNSEIKLHDNYPHRPNGSQDLSDVPAEPNSLEGRMEGVAGGAAFLLSLRAPRLSAHPSQWALPGGRLDTGETPVEAALRETHEEIGLSLDKSSVLGVLDDYPTRSGYVITPVVVWGGTEPEIVVSPEEVVAAYRVGLHALCASVPRYLKIPESTRPVLQIPLGQSLIHPPTGAVLLQFRRVALEGTINERVDHYEQPVFAWK